MCLFVWDPPLSAGDTGDYSSALSSFGRATVNKGCVGVSSPFPGRGLHQFFVFNATAQWSWLCTGPGKHRLHWSYWTPLILDAGVCLLCTHARVWCVYESLCQLKNMTEELFVLDQSCRSFCRASRGCCLLKGDVFCCCYIMHESKIRVAVMHIISLCVLLQILSSFIN